MQNSSALIVTARADQRETSEKLLRIPVPKANAIIRPHHPLTIGLMQIHRGIIKRLTPVRHRRVIVGVGYSDGRDAAYPVDQLDQRGIKQRYAIPQNVARLCLYKKR